MASLHISSLSQSYAKIRSRIPNPEDPLLWISADRSPSSAVGRLDEVDDTELQAFIERQRASFKPTNGLMDGAIRRLEKSVDQPHAANSREPDGAVNMQEKDRKHVLYMDHLDRFLNDPGYDRFGSLPERPGPGVVIELDMYAEDMREKAVMQKELDTTLCNDLAANKDSLTSISKDLAQIDALWSRINAKLNKPAPRVEQFRADIDAVVEQVGNIETGFNTFINTIMTFWNDPDAVKKFSGQIEPPRKVDKKKKMQKKARRVAKK